MKNKSWEGKTLYYHSWFIVASDSKPHKKKIIRATIGAKIEKHCLTFAVARCSHKDQFEKAVGRALVDERITESPYKRIAIGPNNNIWTIFKAQAYLYFNTLGKLEPRPVKKNQQKNQLSLMFVSHNNLPSSQRMVTEAVTE